MPPPSKGRRALTPTQGRNSEQQRSGSAAWKGATATFRTGGPPTPGRKVIERLEAAADVSEKVAHTVQSIAVKKS